MKLTIKFAYTFTLISILLLGGTIYFHEAEKWSVTDSFYFSVVSLTTVGYGDLVPTTDGAKIMTSLYIFFGIGIMFFILTSVFGEYLFRQEKYFERVVSKFKGRHKKK